MKLTEGKQNTRGVLVMAYGRTGLINMAKHLARSLKATNPSLPRAIVTDRLHDSDFNELFDFRIPLEPRHGKHGLRQKLQSLNYTPFEQTLFIDADCLVFKDVGPLFDLLETRPVAMLGKAIHCGVWRFDVPAACKWLSVPSIPKLNTGVFCFNKTDAARAMFESAIGIGENYSTVSEAIGLGRDASGEFEFNDEVCFSLALAETGIPVVDDYTIRRQAGPIQMQSGRVRMDVLKREFTITGNGWTLHPIIGHFFLNFHKSFQYRRETWLVKQHLKHRHSIIVGSARFLLNFLYGVLTTTYRVKELLWRKPDPISIMACIPMDYFGGNLSRRIGRRT